MEDGRGKMEEGRGKMGNGKWEGGFEASGISLFKYSLPGNCLLFIVDRKSVV